MTNNGRSRRKRGRKGETGEFAFLAVGRIEERGKWMLPLRAKLQSPSMGFVLGLENCEYTVETVYRVCMHVPQEITLYPTLPYKQHLSIFNLNNTEP